MNPGVDEYISGSEKWSSEMAALRQLLLSFELNEEIKWGKPCYTHHGANVVILQEMKRFLARMFFKGVLLSDPEGVLQDQGPNSRSAKRIRFTSVEDVSKLAAAVHRCVEEAVAVEEAGLEIPPAPKLVVTDELKNRLSEDAEFAAGFEALTPGRRREYNLYFSSAKQPKTRQARIDKFAQKILDGKGFRDQ